MPDRPERPTIYNRPWHMDADDRRHHGRRRWEPEAVEAFVALLATVDGLYPPDWSGRDVVRFRMAGAEAPFAELRTDKPANLRLVFHLSRPPKLAMEGCRIRIDGDRCEVLLKTAAPLRNPAFATLVAESLAQTYGQSRPG